MSSRRNGRFNVHQLRIDWNGAKALSPVGSEAQPPVLRLRWDFKNRFPQPLPDVVDAGQIADPSPDHVRAIHQEHASKMLEALVDLDAESDQCRQLASRADRRTEPTRWQRWYTNLLGIYEEWFGNEAADAFDRAVRAWHAHVEVVVDNKPPMADIISPDKAIPESPPIIEAEICDPPIAPTHLLPGPAQVRVIARLPAPRPLPAAVAAGHFGMDEQGQPIYPSADEVRDITFNHAEELIDLLAEQREAQRRGPEAHVARLSMDIQTAFMKYAEDFGSHAAERLLAYARRQMLIHSREANRGPRAGR